MFSKRQEKKHATFQPLKCRECTGFQKERVKMSPNLHKYAGLACGLRPSQPRIFVGLVDQVAQCVHTFIMIKHGITLKLRRKYHIQNEEGLERPGNGPGSVSGLVSLVFSCSRKVSLGMSFDKSKCF